MKNLKKQVQRFIFVGVILVIAVMMTFFGVNQKMSETGDGAMAAWVNDDGITLRDFSQQYESRVDQIRSQFGGPVDERFLSQFKIRENILQQMIQVRLFAQEATRLKFKVSDEELIEGIRTTFTRNGKFDAEEYKKIPERVRFEKSLRQDLQLERFQKYLADRIRMTPTQLEFARKAQGTRAELEFARIDFNKFAKSVKPSEAELAAYLKATPSAELESYYNNHSKEYAEPAQVKIRQIRTAIPFQASPEKKTQAKTKIETVAKTLTPKNFAEMAKTQSDDEFAKKGGDAGWVRRGTLERAIENTLDHLEVGKISEPIETPFGYYLVLLEAKKDEVVKKFPEAKKLIAEKLLQEKMAKEVGEKKKKEWEKMLADGQSLDAELKKAGIALTKTGPFSLADGQIPKLVATDTLTDAVFELSKAKPIGKKLIPLQDDFVYFKLVSLDTSELEKKPPETAADRDAVGIQSDVIRQYLTELQKKAKINIVYKFPTPQETAIN